MLRGRLSQGRGDVRLGYERRYRPALEHDRFPALSGHFQGYGNPFFSVHPSGHDLLHPEIGLEWNEDVVKANRVDL